jgi:hypothetical protein
MSSKADSDLAQLGSELADAILGAIPGWIGGAVRSRVTQWVRSGGQVAVEGSELAKMCESAGGQATEVANGPLKDLLLSDVDQQWTTPLALVRPLVRYATEVLEKAGVPGVERDEFQMVRFPDDEYALTPASLSALGDEVAGLAIAWGAAKALAHRQRHDS